MADEGRGLEEIAAELHEKRSSLRVAEAEAAKVAPLQNEIERLKKSERSYKQRLAESSGSAGGLEQRVRELESELRAQADLEQQAQKAQEKARAALEERDQAEVALREAEQEVAAADAEIEGLRAEVGRLQTAVDHFKDGHAKIERAKELA